MVQKPDPTTAAQAAAQWIINQVARSTYLDQDMAVTYLRARFGTAVVTDGAAGTVTIAPAVRVALRTLGAGHVIWEAELRRWRRREWYETPERHAA